ncbi:MAG: hypothetical protein N2594_01340 [Clostridiales bacterium]|nr:hypothetical protein [Clostridiales bacterium]
MDIQKISLLMDILNREKNTSNILYTINKKGLNVEAVTINHSYAVLDLAKLLSDYRINTELSEPVILNKEKEELINELVEDITYYTNLISDDNIDINNPLKRLINIKCQIIQSVVNNKQRELILTVDELLKYDGSNNNPAYVAVDGIIYDVSNSKTWLEGVHYGLVAGRDLTDEINGCHENKEEILSKLVPVGKLKK